jgi:hypothetical protein
MSKVEELALCRIGAIGAAGLDAKPVIDDAVVRAIVADNQRAAQCDPPLPKVDVAGAGAVVTGNDGPRYGGGGGARGWVNPRPLAPPSDLALIDRQIDAQDRIDKAERVQRLRRLGESSR